MEQNKISRMKEFSLVYFFLSASLYFFSFSAILMSAGDRVPNIFLWIAFIDLLLGVFCGAEKIKLWEKETRKIINDLSFYMTT